MATVRWSSRMRVSVMNKPVDSVSARLKRLCASSKASERTRVPASII